METGREDGDDCLDLDRKKRCEAQKKDAANISDTILVSCPEKESTDIDYINVCKRVL